MAVMQESLTGALSLLDRWAQYLNLKADAQALIRLNAIECRRNLALLNALRLEDTSTQTDPDFLQIAKLLETEALESLYAIGPKENKARVLLSQRVDPKNGDSQDDADLPGELLLRIYVRITAMQKLVGLVRAGDGLRDIRWRTRLKNLESDLRQAVTALDITLTQK